MKPKDYFEDALPAKLTPELAKSIGSSFQFYVSGDEGGEWYLDFTRDSDWVGTGVLEDAKCRVTVSDTNWSDLLSGKVKAPMAVMQGKVKVAGNLALALKLQTLID